MKNTRNFSIIIHIDHGKSTLSDRIIQICGDLSDREMEVQALNSMDPERERGITIKAQSVTLDFKASDGETYQFNFIGIPGHVNFSYEASHSPAAYGGVLLVVGVGQGVEARTLANCCTVMEMDLEVTPVLNKIDLLTADPERVTEEVGDIVGIDATDVVHCSAKTGVGVADAPERLVRDTPPPEGSPEGPLWALIIGSRFDNYLGVVSPVRIKNGTMCKGDKIKVTSTGQVYNADRLGIFMSKQVDRAGLKCGEVGWLVCAIKDVLGTPVDSIPTQARNPADKPLPGFKKVKPQVYASLFPVGSDDYGNFRDALGKSNLNDASLFCEPEGSITLGFSFRCGFLGLLHMGIIQERLERKYDLGLITTTPIVVYEVETTAKETIYVDSPSKLPPLNSIYELCKSVAERHMLLPQVYLGSVIILCTEKRDVQTNMVYHGNWVVLMYEIPMAEVVLDFFDRLKSTSRGYTLLDYSFKHFQTSDMVRVDTLINNERVDTLALITHRDNFQSRDHELVEKVEDLTPRQQFNTVIRAAIGTHITTCSAVKQLRKNALAKCYGGDISRRKKPLQKQKEGKRRTKQIDNIELPQEAFLAILHVGRDSKQS